MMVAQLAGWRDGHDRALLAAHARVNGRQPAVDAARSLADRAVTRLLGTTHRPRRLLRDATRGVGLDNDERSWGITLDMVGRYARTVLAAEAAADVLPERLYLSATAVRDVMLADRAVRTLPDERVGVPAGAVLALRHTIGAMSATELRPYLERVGQLVGDARSEWSLGVLRAEFEAAHACRALPPLPEVFVSTSLGSRLRGQRMRLTQSFLAGKDVQTQRAHYDVLTQAVTAYSLWATMPPEACSDLRAILEDAIPASMIAHYRRAS